MDYKETIEKSVEQGIPYNEIARKIYLTYPTKVFIGEEELQYEILKKICTHFDVPISSVQVVGSAKTGYSFHQGTRFEPCSSDLDIAIVDSSLFVKYANTVFKQTKGFSNRANFPIREGKSVFEQYKAYLSKGIFRPDLMPTGPIRASWNSFFGKLSTEYLHLFKSINAGIYMSEVSFEFKQRSSIKNYLENKGQFND